MELRLEQLINQLMRISDIRNINPNNPVKVTLEHPNSGMETILVVAYNEPHQYPLPYNVTWVCADPRNQHYKLALKRSSKNPSGDYTHTWAVLQQYMDVFEPPQYYEAADDPNALPKEFTDHINDVLGNPHRVSPDVIGAVKRQGDTMTGPLMLSGSPSFEQQAANKGYIDTLVGSLTDSVQTLQTTIAQNRSLIDGNTNQINTNHSGILSNLAQIQQNVQDIQTNLSSILINVDAIDQNAADVAQLFSITTATNNALAQLQTDLTNLIAVANMTGYTHEQPSPSDTWVVAHNLGNTNYQWSVIDDTGEHVLPDTVITTDGNNVTISFAQPVAGKAVLAFHAP